MLTIIQSFTFILSIALAAACVWGFMRSKSVGFILLLIGFVLGSLARFVSPWLFTIAGQIFSGLPTQDRFTLLFAIPAVFTSSLVLAGVILLAMGWPKHTPPGEAPTQG